MHPIRSVVSAVRLIHPFPVLVVMLTSAGLFAVASRGVPGLLFLLHGLAAVLASQVATGSLNDYLDRDLDAIHQPDKPIPSGATTAGLALAMAWIGSLATVVLAAGFGPVSALLMAVALSGGLLYDLVLKRTAYSFLGYLLGFGGLVTWIWYVCGQLRPIFLLIYPAAALVVVAAHLANAAPDIETDLLQQQRSLAVRLGPARTVRAIFALYAAAAIPATALILISGAPPGSIVLFAFSLLTALLALAPARRFTTERPARVAVFHLIAPAIAFLALSSLIALQSL